MKRVLSILVVVTLICTVSLVFMGVGCKTTTAETTAAETTAAETTAAATTDDGTIIDLKAAQDMMAVKATGDKTLEFELSRPCPFFDYILAFGSMVPVREDTITANGDGWTTDPKTYLTNGRYVMAERKPDEVIVLQKSDKYWDNASTKIDTIEFKLLADENVAYAAYQTDQVSFVMSVPLGEMETVLASPDYIRGGLLGTYYLDFNVTKPPLDKAEVRKALTLAIDRSYIVSQVTKQNQIPAYAWVSEGIADANGKTFRENGGDLIERDYAKAVEQAKQLLIDAGYPDGKGMPKIEFTYNSDNQGHKIIGEAFANMWKTQLGVEVEMVGVEGTVFNSYRMELKHMIARDGFIADWNDATSLLNLCQSDSGNNHTGWKNQAFDDLLNKAATETDLAVRSQILHDAEKLMMDEMPVAPVYYYTNNFLLKPYVDGACFSPLGNQFFWNCTMAAETTAAETTAAAPSVLSVWAATEPESIDPAKIAWAHEFTLVYHMFEGLVRWDATVPGSVPVLGEAKEIVWDASKTKATVTLRDDIFWSDGKPVLAKDYEYAWKRHVDASLATAYGSTMVDFFKGGTDAYNAVQKSIINK